MRQLIIIFCLLEHVILVGTIKVLYGYISFEVHGGVEITNSKQFVKK